MTIVCSSSLGLITWTRVQREKMGCRLGLGLGFLVLWLGLGLWLGNIFRVSYYIQLSSTSKMSVPLFVHPSLESVYLNFTPVHHYIQLIYISKTYELLFSTTNHDACISTSPLCMLGRRYYVFMVDEVT